MDDSLPDNPRQIVAWLHRVDPLIARDYIDRMNPRKCKLHNSRVCFKRCSQFSKQGRGVATLPFDEAAA